MNSEDMAFWLILSILGICILFLSKKSLWKDFISNEIDTIICLTILMLIGGPFMFVGALMYASKHKKFKENRNA